MLENCQTRKPETGSRLKISIYTVGMTKTVPKLVAHRGYAQRYPENTLLALRAAIELGAEFLECDVLLTQDHVPVLFHDRNLERMCGQQGAVHNYNLSQLRKFSVSEFERFGYRYVGNEISTLEDTINCLLEFPAVTLFVELKRQSIEIFGIAKVVETILAVLEPAQQQVVVISYSLEALRVVRESSSFRIGAVFDKWRDHKQSIIRVIQPEFLFTDIAQLPRLGKLKHPHSTLVVYECTDPGQALRVHHRGVDMVETFAIADMLQSLLLFPGTL